MLVNSKVMAAAATLLLVTGAGVASAMTPALASPGHVALAASGHEVCDEGSPVKCLNAWGGGPSIRTYSPNVANDNFVVQGVNRCNNGDYTTSNCPISGNPSALYIYQIEFVGGGTYNGDCVGDNNPGVSGLAELVGCNHTAYPGTGGGTATIFVAYPGDGITYPLCESGFNYGVNAHFTSGNGSFGGLSGIRWDEEQNDISIDLSFPPGNCLSYIPFG